MEKNIFTYTPRWFFRSESCKVCEKEKVRTSHSLLPHFLPPTTHNQPPHSVTFLVPLDCCAGPSLNVTAGSYPNSFFALSMFAFECLMSPIVLERGMVVCAFRGWCSVLLRGRSEQRLCYKQCCSVPSYSNSLRACSRGRCSRRT